MFAKTLGAACAAVAALALVTSFGISARGQAPLGAAPPLIVQAIDPNVLTVLAGNTRAEARDPANDRGPVANTMPMPNLMLQLRRPAAQEEALKTLIDQLHDRKSPYFHR